MAVRVRLELDCGVEGVGPWMADAAHERRRIGNTSSIVGGV